MNSTRVVLKVDDLKIVGHLYLPGDQPPYPAVCTCHGVPAEKFYPNNKGYRLLAEKICQRGLAVFTFNFRGTGASEGNIDMAGWEKDLKAVIDHLCTLPEIDRSHLSLLGFSGGGSMAIKVAAQDSRISSVVSCASPAEFTPLTDYYNPVSLVEHFRNLGVIRDKDFPSSTDKWFDGFKTVSPIEYVAKIAPRPLLLLHGDKDDVVDISHAYRLYEKAGDPKQLIIVKGVGHRLRRSNKAMEIVFSWLKAYAGISAQSGLS